MPQIWFYSLASVLLVSLLSLVGLATLGVSRERLQRVLFYLVSFSTGALLGDVFLHIIPEIMEGEGALRHSVFILIGIGVFFILERLFIWHHAHTEHSENIHSMVYLVIVGDAIHNFLDGIAIATSFLISIPVGFATSVAVIFHEIPQEIGEFAVLVHGGWSRGKALFYNFVSALSAVFGAVLVLAFAGSVDESSPVISALLALSAASFVYIAMSDLIPELHKESNARRSVFQFIWIVLGVLVMASLLLIE